MVIMHAMTTRPAKWLARDTGSEKVNVSSIQIACSKHILYASMFNIPTMNPCERSCCNVSP